MYPKRELATGTGNTTSFYKFWESALHFCHVSLPLQSLFLKDMANHKSAEKRIRANEIKRVRNRYQHKTTRTVVKKLKATTVRSEADALLKLVASMIDKLAKKNIIHKKKASNQKSKLTKMVNKIAK
jgi:small subunit ribosomal protein S20